MWSSKTHVSLRGPQTCNDVWWLWLGLPHGCSPSWAFPPSHLTGAVSGSPVLSSHSHSSEWGAMVCSSLPNTALVSPLEPSFSFYLQACWGRHNPRKLAAGHPLWSPALDHRCCHSLGRKEFDSFLESKGKWMRAIRLLSWELERLFLFPLL